MITRDEFIEQKRVGVNPNFNHPEVLAEFSRNWNECIDDFLAAGNDEQEARVLATEVFESELQRDIESSAAIGRLFGVADVPSSREDFVAAVLLELESEGAVLRDDAPGTFEDFANLIADAAESMGRPWEVAYADYVFAV